MLCLARGAGTSSGLMRGPPLANADRSGRGKGRRDIGRRGGPAALTRAAGVRRRRLTSQMPQPCHLSANVDAHCDPPNYACGQAPFENQTVVAGKPSLRLIKGLPHRNFFGITGGPNIAERKIRIGWIITNPRCPVCRLFYHRKRRAWRYFSAIRIDGVITPKFDFLLPNGRL